jgi:hypothetical protein
MSSEQDTTMDSDELSRMLSASEALDVDVYSLLESGCDTSSQRHVICMAYCKAAVVHAISQRVLIEDGLHGTALGLIRLYFETVVRAAWVLHGAKDDWLVKFSAPVPPGDLSEPQMGPPIPAMLDAVASVAPEAAVELRRLNETVRVMHSFVHGGAHLVVHALRGYPPEKLVAVLQNRNLLSLMLSNVIVAASQKPALRSAVRGLMDRHSGCMPPMKVNGPD